MNTAEIQVGTHVWVKQDRADFACTGAIVASVRRAANGTVDAVRVQVGPELSKWLPVAKVRPIDYDNELEIISHVRLLIDGQLSNWIGVDQIARTA